MCTTWTARRSVRRCPPSCSPSARIVLRRRWRSICEIRNETSERSGSIEEINSTQNKDARIQSLQPFVKNGYIKFSKKHKTLLKQMTEYPMGKNDDAPDGLQMAVKLALDVKIGRRVDYRSVIARALDFRRGAY